MLDSKSFSSESAINIIDGCLIYTLPGEINNEVLGLVRKDILNKMESEQILGVIVDFCSVNIIDSYEFEQISELLKVIELLGAKAILVGLQPGIVSTLIYLDINTDDIETCFNLEDGIEFLSNNRKINSRKGLLEKSEK